MSQQFYNTQKAAEVLGVKPADVNQLREQIGLDPAADRRRP